MKNIKFLFKTIFTAVLPLLVGCQEDDYGFGEIIAPSNLQITAEIAGASAENPNGDGSGTVTFTARADNAISYRFVYNGDDSVAASGSITYNFGNTGLSSYVVTAIAVGTGGVTTSTSIQTDVLVLYAPPADLLTMLTADASRTWRIKSEAAGHFGLGPVGGVVPGEWYAATASEKSDTGMYDDRYIFNIDGTFTHITNSENDDPTEDVTGTVFGRDGLIDELGAHSETPNGADIENYPLSDYTAQWGLSAPNGAETISLTGLAFMGYYTGGNHKYEIFERSANEMVLKTTDGNSEFDWWFVLVAE